MNKFIIIFLLFCATTISVAQDKSHIINANTDINALFKGEGFVFESVGYEYLLNTQHSIGFRMGWGFRTSKMEIVEEERATTRRDLLLALNHHYFPFRNGIFVSPEVYYTNGMLSVNDERSHGHGLHLSFGYRHYFNSLVLSGALFAGYEYSFQKNDLYTFRSKEIIPIGIRVTVGLTLGR
jgi:hypothetical protein